MQVRKNLSQDRYVVTRDRISDPVISLQNVSYFYLRRSGLFRKKRFWVLKDVSFDVYPGETLGIIGKNGAGKTTLLKIIAGILQPDKGEIINDGYKASLLSLQAGFVPYLSGRENTYLNGMILGIKRHDVADRIESIKSFSGLGDFFEEPIRSYSTGMRARLGFSIGLQLDTDVLLVDEVLGVGDGEFRIRSTEKMKERIRSDKTVILVSHTPQVIREMCDRIIWLEEGNPKAIGTHEEILPLYQKHLQTRGFRPIQRA